MRLQLLLCLLMQPVTQKSVQSEIREIDEEGRYVAVDDLRLGENRPIFLCRYCNRLLGVVAVGKQQQDRDSRCQGECGQCVKAFLPVQFLLYQCSDRDADD